MQYVLPRLQIRLHKIDKIVGIDLHGGGLGAAAQRFVEIMNGHAVLAALPVLLTVYLKAETYAGDRMLRIKFPGHIAGGIGGNSVAHTAASRFIWFWILCYIISPGVSRGADKRPF